MNSALSNSCSLKSLFGSISLNSLKSISNVIRSILQYIGEIIITKNLDIEAQDISDQLEIRISKHQDYIWKK